MKFNTLKLLADENVSKKIVQFLKQQNIDIVSVEERGWVSKTDIELLQYAFDEQRFIFTYDSDFGELVFKHKQALFGIIYMRLRKTANVIQMLQSLIQSDLDIKAGMIVVIDDNKIRTKQVVQLL